VEKHFSRNDGYITTQLVYQYRLALYYEKIGDDLERDKCLAFVIANGKEHHTAKSARMKFKGLVNVDEFVIKESTEEIQPSTQNDPLEIETTEEPTNETSHDLVDDSEDKKEE
jgi:hypothetical protein